MNIFATMSSVLILGALSFGQNSSLNALGRFATIRSSVDHEIERPFAQQSTSSKEDKRQIAEELSQRVTKINNSITDEQLVALGSGSSRVELQSLSAAFQQFPAELRNPRVEGAFSTCAGKQVYVSSISTSFWRMAMPDAAVVLNIFQIGTSPKLVMSHSLPEMSDTESTFEIIPTTDSSKCVIFVHGHDTKKMQYHERAALYELSGNDLRLLWESDRMQGPEFRIELDKVTIKQNINLVGGDFSPIAEAERDFKGYAVRTMLVLATGVTELPPQMIPTP